jgi:hypothetical protein
MKPRYQQYFMRNIMSIRDDFATYYVQEQLARRDTMVGVDLVKFFTHRQSVKWIGDCMAYDRSARYELRRFLSETAPRSYLLHRMNDRQVIAEVARVLMDGDFPVVIRPDFEPPWRQSELIDMLYEVRYGVPGTEHAIGSTSKQFQFKNHMLNKWPEITLDGSALDNIINMPEAVFNTLVNEYVVDVSNAFLWDAQYVQDHGFKKWFADGLKNQWAVLKTDTKKLEELARKGPNELLWYLTSYELWEDVSTQLKSVFYAESWKNAFAILIPAALLQRFIGGKRAGLGSSTRAEANATRKATKRKIKAKPVAEPKPRKKPATKPGPKTTHRAKDLSKKEFKNPKEAYDHINKLDDDVNKIAKRKVGRLSNKDADLLKKRLREGLPADEYPDIDFGKIDKAIDKKIGNDLSQQEINELKDYIFKNKDFEPPLVDKVTDKELFDAFNKNKENWAKLIDGKVDNKADTFLKHEYIEMEIKKISGYEKTNGMDRVFMHDDIHNAVLEVFNTQL